MKFSRSTGYGLIAAAYIAKNGDPKTAILASSIAKEFDIPLEYLLKILQNLVRANVLRSKRGPRGGFYLAKQPGDINLLEIIEAVDGPANSEIQLPERCDELPYMKHITDACKEAVDKTKNVLVNVKLSAVIKG
ncbi:RrF2 family transcriptional regulator [Sedimentisphaera salicampi]|uniref:Cysteine metabolism repressor n=1 Tax=Sedimentisphaera salicampi TaxID=1941349 RepID=A0A1W6LM05_9BACT|nr:Rrf2 family transcriptional regulator [Sedimentisphaera salicampi]ARN56791.1 Cysteine metabolism repressor [Sedimentisphaera salicampi]OXU14969.1 Cysteine metabolism repressor [Sedimentisphaera salicampi]